MNKKVKISLIGIIVMIFLVSIEITYSRYIITRNFNLAITTAPFYFNVTQVNNSVVFERTSDTSDYDTILMDTTTFNLNVANNDGTNYNIFETTYEFTMESNEKYTFTDGSSETDTITKTIKGGSKITDNITLNLKIKNMESPLKTFKIKVKSTSPYEKEYEFSFNVTQKGAIQTIEDLLDLSLSVRNMKNKEPSSAVISQRFKMTRDLDFQDTNSYENAYRTDYGDINLNNIEAEDLYHELNSDTGFLPIGIDTDNYEFKGAFNGGSHTLSNLQIHKSLQANIGLFGNTKGATIKNLNIENGHVTNENQTAGMIVGKAEGGLLYGLDVKGSVVESRDMMHTAEDTYTGGIVGYIEKDARIENCINRASVTTLFNGDVNKYAGAAGGITAWAAHTDITNCENYGPVTGQSYVGGIAGFFGMQVVTDGPGSGTLSGCTNYGTIDTNSTGKHIGGIAGYNKLGATITNNKNDVSAKVHGFTNVGGIVGNNAGTLTNNHNYSKSINGSSYVGNIYGRNSGTVSGNVEH